MGNPGLSQFPANTPCDCQARGVKEMQYYNGRIYVGYGYWGYGGSVPPYCGPHVSVRVWQIDSSGALSVALQTIDEETRRMFVEEGKLLVSPMDTNCCMTTMESFYWIFDGSTWQNALLDGANKSSLNGFFKNAFYVNCMQYGNDLKRSADMGQTWKTILDYDVLGFSVGNAISMGDYLLMMGAETIDPAINLREGRIFKWYPDDSYQVYKIIYPTGSKNAMAHQLSRFKDGVIYVLRYEPYDLFNYDSELLFLNQFYEGGAARALSGFAESKNVIDAIVRGNTVYVFSVAPSATNQFKGYIYSSTDLNNWTRVAEFIVPALPYAFEMLDSTGDFYIGLGNRDPYEDTEGDDAHPAYADPESGSIYKVTSDIGKPDISLIKQVSTANGKSGDEITYQILCENIGSAEARNLQITDVIPAGAQYVVGSANPAADLANNTLAWTIPSLAPGGSGNVSFRVRID